MARPRKLNATKQGHRTKEELEDSELKENGLNQFDKLTVNNTPTDLTDQAQKEWNRIVPLLQELPIAELDYTLIKKYCELVDINNNAYSQIQIVGTFDTETNKKTGAFAVYMESLKELRSVCGSLGLTIDSRMRIVVPVENEKKQSVYDQFGVDDDD
ncbi:phage terminase small subunit P27 family [Staphylococcus warneri]|uniref:phage terminase small subunit P27 family n=1 Tax=Staphylococcus TaxID=1279 RepID=UPI0006407E07|nr:MULTISPECIES: phage terminase small subunit P27 family [Staphylococcus]KTW16709.1 terminase [Staphylococcus warneri]MCC8990595.1 phage terminase small subunit P27 family [Staphylococcus sp.]PNN64312.1 phage terminase small subunit P27 family [Staphylococcus sp. FDAARGOS_39]